MEKDETLIEKYYYEFLNQHFVKLGDKKRPKYEQFKFKLYPYAAKDYCGEEELKEIKKDEIKNGISIFCRQLEAVNALALANKFSELFKNRSVKVDNYIDEELLEQREIFFFVAYMFTFNENGN